MVRTPFTAMSVCLLREGGEENGGCCCNASLLIVPEVPNVWYETSLSTLTILECASRSTVSHRFDILKRRQAKQPPVFPAKL